ncbi:VCBS repeat-containing protein [Streptomyces venezuelae]|uniref:FG-GAP repeat domain-containing protein n=1 Tax=Streptomyces venezuelae TaxID=54571 RepID=UPI00123B7640|nr:VCBS repeat-containing protein [Streptomyces venezuelae]QES04211.1 VCBS repeat-containing protein [Streptomyces venezuelae]
MSRPRSTAVRRLGAFVAVVLMATAGPAVLPAGAATGTGSLPGAAPAATADATAPVLKPGDKVLGMGRTGFLSQDADDYTLVRWTRLADGAVTTFPYTSRLHLSRDSDIAVLHTRATTTLRDLATGTDLFSVPLNWDRYAGAVGSHLFFRADLSGHGPLDVYSPGPDGPVRRTVTGLPEGAFELHVVAGADGEALVRYFTGEGTTAVAEHLAIVDLDSATVTSSRRIPAGGPMEWSAYAFSSGYVAWTEYDSGAGTSVVVLDRSTQKVQRFPMPTPGRLLLGLAGDWVTYSRPGGLLAEEASTLIPLTARSLTGTTTRKLLDHTVSGCETSGDTLGFLGGTVAGGEGLYRVAPGTDGVPVATRLAATGRPTQVTLLGQAVPTTVDLDLTGGKLPMSWVLSRTNVTMWVTFRNTRTGESITEYVAQPERGADPQPTRFDWNGTLNWQGDPNFWTSASAGPYTWEISASPLNRVGPTLKASGSFTVTRKTGAHDYDSDGSPDILARDQSGNLWLQDVHYREGWREAYQNPDSLVGGGWQAYDRIEATGNIAGAAAPELVARDRSGVLWLYQGTGNGKAPFTTRTRIGGGWQAYTLLTGGSDLTGDGRPDLVATDGSGRLWLYRSTGSATAPFAARRLIGSGGWQTYDRIVATGNLAGAAGDLVARDRAGVLWLYLGKGDGTFAARTRLGGGWQSYDDLIGPGDTDRDGKPDLYAADINDAIPAPFLYRGTGAWQGPFRPGERVELVQDSREFNLFA